VVGTRVHDLHALGVFAVTFPSENADVAKRFWQHTGEIVSSRLASAALKVMNRTSYEMEDNKDAPATDKGVGTQTETTTEANATATGGGSAAAARRDPRSPTAVDVAAHATTTKGGGAKGSLGVARDGIARGKRVARDSLRARISGLLSTDQDNVFLYPTGMATINSAHRLLKLTSRWKSTPLPTVVFGFPYLDTLKLSQIQAECKFFGRGDDEDFAALEEYLETSETGISGLLCEFPSNPLLLAPDLDRLRVLADKHKFPIVCDDTVAGFANVDLLQEGGVDILCSSLTKQFSGSGNVMGGSIVLNPEVQQPNFVLLYDRPPLGGMFQQHRTSVNRLCLPQQLSMSHNRPY
jgi:cystathionine gamma-synthase